MVHPVIGQSKEIELESFQETRFALRVLAVYDFIIATEIDRLLSDILESLRVQAIQSNRPRAVRDFLVVFLGESLEFLNLIFVKVVALFKSCENLFDRREFRQTAYLRKLSK